MHQFHILNFSHKALSDPPKNHTTAASILLLNPAKCVAGTISYSKLNYLYLFNPVEFYFTFYYYYLYESCKSISRQLVNSLIFIALFYCKKYTGFGLFKTTPVAEISKVADDDQGISNKLKVYHALFG